MRFPAIALGVPILLIVVAAMTPGRLGVVVGWAVALPLIAWATLLMLGTFTLFPGAVATLVAAGLRTAAAR